MRKSLIFVMILVLALLALPSAVDALLEQQLSRRLGPTHIDSVSVNLFRGRVSATGIAIDGVGGSDLALGFIDLDIDMLELLSGNLVAESLTGRGLQLLIEQTTEGHPVVLLVVKPAASEQTETTLTLPLFTVSRFSITDSQLELRTEWANGELELEEFTMSGFSSAADASADMILRASWADTTLDWQGSLQAFAAEPEIAGRLTLGKLNLAEISPALPLAQRHLQIGGSLDLALNLAASLGPNIAVTLDGDIEASQLSLQHPDQGFDLARIAGLQIKDLSLKSDNSVTIASLSLDQVYSLQDSDRDEQLFSAGTVRIDEIRYQDASLALGALDAQQMRSVLRVTPEGKLQTIGILSQTLAALSAAEAEEAAGGPAESGSPFHYAIGSFTASDSQLQVFDQRFEPAVSADIAVEEFAFTGVDSRTPATAGKLLLRGKLGTYGKIRIEGLLAPLAEPLAFDLEGELEGASLPVFSPYLVQMVGYEISAGQYDHRFKASLLDNLLDSDNQLKLRKLKLKKIKGAEPDAPLPIPLDMSLDLLRDSDGMIELDLPVKGRLDDPRVGTEQIVSKALGKALQGGSIAMLKYALQPYGAIWSGAELGLKLMTTIRLDPMAFAPGSSELQATQLDYANKVADLLIAKSHLQLTLCGIAGAADFEWLQRQPTEPPPPPLKALAEQRQEALLNYLVEQRQLDPKRIYLCQPQTKENGKISGVELNL